MMLKKSSAHKKPAKQDFSALDDAVSELSKQTAALWGKSEESRPVLPKRNLKPHAKGKSFDIIQAPKGKMASKAYLKTVKVTSPVSSSQESEVPILLPDHAGKSFNETSGADETPDAAQTSKLAATPVIINHREGRLQIPLDEPAPEDSTEDVPPADTEPSAKEPAPAEPSAKVKPAARTSISFEEKEPTSSPNSAEATAQEGPETPQTEAYTSGEAFAHNLVKAVEPKRHTPNEKQQKPTVFDTNEYHPALHDWSKLEHRSGGKILILLLLLAVAGVLGYIVISGQELPFL